ncbi:MAG: class I SAM-dependent methyltransferase [Desulfovibrio sp.]|jgi:hypothetical protein|nr:class I SAM-dependent methyltransferase [Desulfovibrio sp.]
MKTRETTDSYPKDKATRERDQYFDDLKQSLRAGDAKGADASMKALLRGAGNGDIGQTLMEIEENARWEMQCGADPLTCCRVVFNIRKRFGDSKGMQDSARMLKIYSAMLEDGVDIRNIKACRLHMEQKNWHDPATTSKEERLRFDRSIGYWRQMRLLSAIDPLLESFPGAEWLSLGDGRHAIEARYVETRGGRGTPADITDYVLKTDVEAGIISRYRVEFFEKLGTADGSYDFVLAKDALHHCAQPWLGIYEMLRTAREGVCFIEPYDHAFWHSHLSFPPDSAPPAWHGFEDGVGNYIYSFMDREVAKLCMGMGLPFLACKGFNDCYDPKLDPLEAVEGSPQLAAVQNFLEEADQKSAAGEQGYALIAFVILKRPPLSGLREKFARAGFRVVPLPRNEALEKAFLNHKYFSDQEG